MISRAYARTMAAYNRWMNDRLYECCARLSDEERKRDVGAFFKSIHGTLNHLLFGDRIWLGRFTSKPFAVKSLDQELHADFAQLRTERDATDGAITEWASVLTDADLASEPSDTSLTNPGPRRYPWFAVTHFFNHQTHHRGQLTTLLVQPGIDPGVTDLIRLSQGASEPLAHG